MEGSGGRIDGSADHEASEQNSKPQDQHARESLRSEVTLHSQLQDSDQLGTLVDGGGELFRRALFHRRAQENSVPAEVTHFCAHVLEAFFTVAIFFTR